MVRERRLILPAWEVQAFQERRKSEVRVPIPGVPEGITEVHRWGALDPTAHDPELWGFWGCEGFDSRQPHNCYDFETRCPFGQPGDLLWVAETWMLGDQLTVCYAAGYGDPSAANCDRKYDSCGPRRWLSPAAMPRRFSRLTLKVKRVWTERVQEITEESFKAEAPGAIGSSSLVERSMLRFWWQIRWGDRYPWDSNPWVWAAKVTVV